MSVETQRSGTEYETRIPVTGDISTFINVDIGTYRPR